MMRSSLAGSTSRYHKGSPYLSPVPLLIGDPDHRTSEALYSSASNVHLGRLDEARAELSRLLAMDPKLTIAGYREYAHFQAPEVHELFVTGLRLAGLPEK